MKACEPSWLTGEIAREFSDCCGVLRFSSFLDFIYLFELPGIVNSESARKSDKNLRRWANLRGTSVAYVTSLFPRLFLAFLRTRKCPDCQRR
jgi:hypothetical protein